MSTRQMTICKIYKENVNTNNAWIPQANRDNKLGQGTERVDFF